MILSGDERVTLIGHTGSGKSYAARYLLAMQAAEAASRRDYRIYILWTKPERTPLFAASHFPPGTKIRTIGSVPTATRDAESVNVIALWRDKRTWGLGAKYDDWVRAQIDMLCRDIYLRAARNRDVALLYVDEMNRVTNYRPNGGPPWFRRLYTEGRGLGVGVWGGMQRPAFTQGEALSEREHILVFRLEHLSDQKKAADMLHLAKMEEPPDPHGFWYRGPGGAAVYYPSIEVACGQAVLA